MKRKFIQQLTNLSSTSEEKWQKLAFSLEILTEHFIQQPCGIVQTLDHSERCEFVTSTKDCKEDINYVDYLNCIYCQIGESSENAYIAGVFLMCIWCIYLFLLLGTTADKLYDAPFHPEINNLESNCRSSFCPALAVLSKILRMSENLAGVTLLAFGNGSPDILTSLSNLDGDTELMYCELMGEIWY